MMASRDQQVVEEELSDQDEEVSFWPKILYKFKYFKYPTMKFIFM